MTKPLSAFGAVVAAFGLNACSTIGALNAVTPGPGPVARDISYGPGPRHTADVYAPGRTPAPVVVFFYGGGWDTGDKADYAFVGKALASRGYVAVIPDYRLYPEVRYPAFLQDSALAVAWAKAHAAEYGGDPGRMVLMGHSAGAYNAAMLALDPRWLGEVGLDPKRDLRGMVGLAGPYDFLPLQSEKLKIIFGPEDQRPRTQPVGYVDGADPPVWLAHDLGDTVVDPGNMTRLAAAVRGAGGSVETRSYRGLNHALIAGALAWPLRFLAPVLRDASAFIDAKTAP